MFIALLFSLILLNGVFAMAEIALVTARKNRLQKLAEKGDRAAATAIQLGEEPTQFLSTVQIGITAIGILTGIVSEEVLARPLTTVLQDLGMASGTAILAATGIVVVVVTYIAIVIGELVPKRIGQLNAEQIARFMALPIALLARLSRPFVWLLTVSTDGLLRLTGRNEASSEALTEEDIHAMLAEGSQAGVIEQQEHVLVRNVFHLDDRLIPSLMTPRSEIVSLDVDRPVEELLQVISNSAHSCFPVCRGSLKLLLGIITAKQLLEMQGKGEDLTNLRRHLLPPVFVPELLTGIKLLEQFRQSDVKMVFVVDEYGDIMGLVTQQDMLEALAGEFTTDDPEESWAVARQDGSWLLDGLIPIPELMNRLGLSSVPEATRGTYSTLGGMMLWMLGEFPATGAHVVWEGWCLEVVDMDGNRIDKVLATKIPDPNITDAPAH